MQAPRAATTTHARSVESLDIISVPIRFFGIGTTNVNCYWSGAMKSMTCRQLGGKCDQKLSASSWDEMVTVMTKHVIEKHPDVAAQMEKMHNEDPKKWGKEMKPKWEATPET